MFSASCQQSGPFFMGTEQAVGEGEQTASVEEPSLDVEKAHGEDAIARPKVREEPAPEKEQSKEVEKTDEGEKNVKRKTGRRRRRMRSRRRRRWRMR